MFCIPRITVVMLISISSYEMVSTDLTSSTQQEASTKTAFKAIRNTLPPISSNYQCLSNADCGVDQCCHKIPKNPIFSKRFLEIQSPGPFGDYYIGSSCSNKAKEGIFCPFYVCGCIGNLTCRMVQISTPFPLLPTIPHEERVRRTFPPKLPGYDYRCV